MTDHTSPIRVAIVDYGLGNLFSVKYACAEVGLEASITADDDEIRSADGILLPGVGAFGDAMACLRRLNLVNTLRQAAASGQPLAGICLGMQLLMSESLEFGRHAGLDLLPGRVVRLAGPQGPRGPLKVPQVGWNRIYRPSPSVDAWADTPLAGLEDGVSMYFVHSYYVQVDRAEDALCLTRYGQIEFCSAVRRDNVLGFQFHPERSGQRGLRVYAGLASFIRQHLARGAQRNAA